MRDPTARERAGDAWQRVEPPRDPDLFASRTRRQARAPGEPLGAGAEPVAPATTCIELADEVQKARGRCIEVGRELGDLVTKAIQLRRVVHSENLLSLLRRPYTRVSD